MNYTRVNTELVRGVALIVAMAGLIFLGSLKPDSLGSAAIGGLSGVIGGYFGLASPKARPEEETKPEEETNDR